jgi:hypothetical protein
MSAVEAHDVVGLGAVELQRLRRRAVLELQRQHAHADEVGAVDALEALGHDRPSRRAGWCPSRPSRGDEPVPYSWPAKTMSGVPSLLVGDRRVVDR